MKIDNVEIHWLGHDSFKLVDMLNKRTIYIDPYQISSRDPADIVLITHSHHDHCSLEDLGKITTKNTVILSPVDAQKIFQGKTEQRESVVMMPGKRVSLGNINIEAVPAYNTNKNFHPKGNQWLGYVIDLNSKRIYHAGDSDSIPEMARLKNIDVALVPVSGTYVMTAEEAAMAVSQFKPKLAIPMHYGSIVGTKRDADNFKTLSSVPVEILKKE